MTGMLPRDKAELAQRAAADPAVSAWVEASAGSGKTKLLTDRVLRLLLDGTPPNRILCLTFTKAAAAEMATRLHRELGKWATMDGGDLHAALLKLTGDKPGDARLRAARRLFVQVLEQPGGMRIATIHAFAQSLLRAFPLEAGLPPQFSVLEDRDAAALLAEARESVLAGAQDQEALRDLARLVPPTAFAQLVATLAQSRGDLLPGIARRQGLDGLRSALVRALGLSMQGATEDGLLATACAAGDDTALLRAARLLGTSGNEKTDQKKAIAMAAWLEADVAQRAARWQEWCGVFLTKEGQPLKTLVTKDKRIAAHYDDIQTIMQQEAERVRAVNEGRAAARVLAATMALLRLGKPMLDHYASGKRMAGQLDYDDLIAAARTLLQDPGSAWVLFKLDGGLDHVLLDEAQDSNPEQWGIVRALTEEFFAGQGVVEGPRSIFAVGDVKQSIYRFQGADAEGFGRERSHYSAVVTAAEQTFLPQRLDVSFRSTAPVLGLVDAVFAEGLACDGVVEAGDTLRHFPDRAGHAGSVELWPLMRPEETAAPPEWAPPEQAVDGTGPAEALAAALAARIKAMIGHETLPARGPDRKVRAGDILVLVKSRARGGFFAALVRELKQRDVPVGGMDRMVLAEQLAVQDMLALCDVLLLPEDDLQLAVLLKSPLVGLSEDDLFALAHGRTGSLWTALLQHRGANTVPGRAADWLARLADRADLCTPHALLAEVLGEHLGRAKLLARLGPEANDPLDELLSAALNFEARHPASLQGFLHWLRSGGAEVKREAESGADAVRIMTVHGAKGLQAPIVILPDTIGEGQDRSGLRWIEDGAGDVLPAWAPRQDGFGAAALLAQRQRDQQADAREAHRLLYVALTRAEDRLLVCGWHSSQAPRDGCWYRLIEAGFRRLAGMQESAFDPAGFGASVTGFAEGPLLRLECAQTAEPRPDAPHAATGTATALPAWLSHPAPAEAAEVMLAPSSLPGEDETPAAAPTGEQDPQGLRFRRGRLVHALLQYLPDLPVEARSAAAARYLARPGHGLDTRQQAETLAEVEALLAAPAMQAALGPGSVAEAALAGRVGRQMILGQVDRLLVTPDRVLVLDYKTNRPPPAVPEAVAPIYLRQMAAYRALLRQAYPGRRVEAALVWTYGARLMPLHDALLDQHAPPA